MTNFLINLSEFLRNTEDVSNTEMRIDVKENNNEINLSLAKGLTAQTIEDIENKFNIIFVSVVPYQKYSGASWINIIFKKGINFKLN